MSITGVCKLTLLVSSCVIIGNTILFKSIIVHLTLAHATVTKLLTNDDVMYNERSPQPPTKKGVHPPQSPPFSSIVWSDLGAMCLVSDYRDCEE